MAKDDDSWSNPLEGETEPKLRVEVEQDEPKAPKIAPKQTSDDVDESDDEISKRVQKRINNLTKRWKTSEETRQNELAQWETEKAELVQRLTDATKQTQTAVKVGVDNYEKNLKDKLALAQTAFEDAYDTGDKKKLSAAQLTMSETTAELKLLEAQKAAMPRQARDENGEEQTGNRQRQAPQQRQQPAKPHPKAKAWLERNSEWFGNDEFAAETASVLALDGQLMREGEHDPGTDEYYEELETRMKKKFPALWSDEQEEEEAPRPVQKRKVSSVVTGGSRTPGGTKKITLSKSEADHAKRLGVSVDEYGANKLKAEAAGDGYTNIFT